MAEYASHFFDYDAQGLVSTHRLLGGSQTTFSYQDGDTNSSDFNQYRRGEVGDAIRRPGGHALHQLPEPTAAGGDRGLGRRRWSTASTTATAT